MKAIAKAVSNGLSKATEEISYAVVHTVTTAIDATCFVGEKTKNIAERTRIKTIHILGGVDRKELEDYKSKVEQLEAKLNLTIEQGGRGWDRAKRYKQLLREHKKRIRRLEKDIKTYVEIIESSK